MIPDAVDHNCRPSNIIRDWVKKLNLEDWSTAYLDEELEKRRKEDKMTEGGKDMIEVMVEYQTMGSNLVHDSGSHQVPI